MNLEYDLARRNSHLGERWKREKKEKQKDSRKAKILQFGRSGPVASMVGSSANDRHVQVQVLPRRKA